jgi:hypothetical protein
VYEFEATREFAISAVMEFVIYPENELALNVDAVNDPSPIS